MGGKVGGDEKVREWNGVRGKYQNIPDDPSFKPAGENIQICGS